MLQRLNRENILSADQADINSTGIALGGTDGMDESGAAVRIADACFPAPFAQGLEFNAPAHGAWNIVHVGMLVPECHQIYVCADNCMRGVVLTAAEMGASDRFSCVLLEEEDLYEGSLETATIEGITDALNRILSSGSYRPRAVAVFLVCLHHFVGTDTGFVYRTLEERFPDIDFMRCWMDPVMRRSGLSPEQKLKESMFRPIRPLPVNRKLVCDLGDNQPLDKDSELFRAIEEAGFTLFQLHDCKSYDDYLRMGAAALFITRSFSGVHGVTQLAKRLGRPFLYLPPACGEEEICGELNAVRKKLENITAAAYTSGKICMGKNADEAYPGKTAQAEESLPIDLPIDKKEQKANAENTESVLAKKALAHALSVIGSTEVTIDHFATSRPLSLARLLLESGFNVTRVYLDAAAAEEEADFKWMQGHFPDLFLNATVHPKMRVLHGREGGGKMLAIGPKAAWFGGTSRFVNVVECSGLWGFSGITKLAAQMEDAFLNEKDTRSIVPKKGFGCNCVF